MRIWPTVPIGSPRVTTIENPLFLLVFKFLAKPAVLTAFLVWWFQARVDHTAQGDLDISPFLPRPSKSQSLALGLGYGYFLKNTLKDSNVHLSWRTPGPAPCHLSLSSLGSACLVVSNYIDFAWLGNYFCISFFAEIIWEETWEKR